MRLQFIIGSLLFLFVSATLWGEPSSATQNAEYKTLIEVSHDSSRVLKSLGFDPRTSKRADIYFYDTHDLKLFGAGLMISSRSMKSAPDDISVKARPVVINELDPSWLSMRGFSCSIEESKTKSETTCSLIRKASHHRIIDVAEGRRTLSSLLTQDQDLFANDFGAYDSFKKDVRVLGPIVSLSWGAKTNSGSRVECEYWKLADGTEFLELS